MKTHRHSFIEEHFLLACALISLLVIVILEANDLRILVGVKGLEKGEWQDYNCTTVEWCKWQCQRNGSRLNCNSGIPICIDGYNVTTCTQQIFLRTPQ